MKQPAREVLTVVSQGRLSAGLSFYGLSLPGFQAPVFPADSWPEDTECRRSRLHDGAWEVVVWDVVLSEWPRGDEWSCALRTTLAAFMDVGCAVAWVGREGYFCDPPDLFDPACMSEGVLAALTKENDFTATLDPDAPVRPLTDKQLLQLRQSAKGLADAV